MKTKVNLLFALALAFTVCACYPGGAEYVDELDTSISKYDKTYGWDKLDGKTYYMPDEIAHIKNGKKDDEPNTTHDEAILEQARNHLSAQGLTPAVANQDTALAVAVTIIEQNNTGAAWIPGGGWWGAWYPGYPDWGWNGYYPWYPAYYSYKTGSLVIEMAAYAKKQTKEPPLVYTGVLDGLMQGKQSYLDERIDNGIDELFNQAPFN